MVLSNKKLKLKLRAESAEVKVAKPLQSTPASDHESLKVLLNSAGKPRLSKREKRRLNITTHTGNGEIKEPHAARNGEHLEEMDANGLLNGECGSKSSKKETKRKRKKEDDDGQIDGPVEISEGGKKKKKGKHSKSEENGDDLKFDAQGSKNKNKKQKQKRKQQKKRKKKLTKDDGQDKLAVVHGASGHLRPHEAIDCSASQGNPEDSNKVYAGGIPFYSTEDDIRSFFDHCGTITDVDCMKFPESGKFRGIAIISFKTETAAKRALALDGADMGGLFLKIQPYKNTRGSKTSDFCPPVIDGYNRIYAGNLSWEITEDDLKDLFSDCSISSIRFGEDKETGEFKGYAHVDFSDSTSVTKALQFDQKILCGRPVRISRAVPKKGVASGLHPKIGTGIGSGSGSGSGSQPKNDVDTQPAAVSHDNTTAEASHREATNSGVSSGKLRRRTCYECGQKGHLFSDCPKKKEANDSTQIQN